MYDVAKNEDRALNVRLASDLDQTRERWVSDPLSWVSAAHVSPNGDRVVLTARGQVFVAPLEDGRLVQVTRDDGVRWRSARFMPDGKTLMALSDASGEVEWSTLPANGLGSPRGLTKDAKTLRFDGVASPDGKYIASTNKEQELWLLEVASGRVEVGDQARVAGGGRTARRRNRVLRRRRSGLYRSLCRSRWAW